MGWVAIDLGDGVHPAEAMLAAARDAAPKRRTMLDDALSGGALTYHSARSDEE